MVQLTKQIIIVFFLLSASYVPNGYGSVIVEPQCFVELQTLESVCTDKDSGHVNGLIISILDGNCVSAGISVGDVYRLTVPSDLTVKKGEILQAGAVAGSTMGESGTAIEWIHWAPLKYKNGELLRDDRGRVVLSFHSDTSPVDPESE